MQGGVAEDEVPRSGAGSSALPMSRKLRGLSELLRPYRGRVVLALLSLVLARPPALPRPT